MPREVKQAQTRLYRPGKRAVQNKKPNMIYMRSHKQLDKPDLTDSQWILAQSQNDRARNGWKVWHPKSQLTAYFWREMSRNYVWLWSRDGCPGDSRSVNWLDKDRTRRIILNLKSN